jgi:inner membrane protein
VAFLGHVVCDNNYGRRKMLAKAHVTVGMAAAFTIMKPETVAGALPVIAGGALGCLICDLDCEVTKEKTESSHWRIVMGLITAAALIEDHLLNAGMWNSLGSNGPYLWFAGLVFFVLTGGFASVSNHRGFSHSLLALALFAGSLWLIIPAMTIPFVITFVYHLILDMLNKRSVRLFYPAEKGVCLGMFYADRFANKVFALAGSMWLIAAVVLSLRR